MKGYGILGTYYNLGSGIAWNAYTKRAIFTNAADARKYKQAAPDWTVMYAVEIARPTPDTIPVPSGKSADVGAYRAARITDEEWQAEVEAQAADYADDQAAQSYPAQV